MGGQDLWLCGAPRGLHESNICLAATSSHVFESIRKICYYKISPARLEFIGNYAWVVLGVAPPSPTPESEHACDPRRLATRLRGLCLPWAP